MIDYSLSESFWREFKNDYWEKCPVHFHKLFDEGIVTSDSLFSVIAGMPATKTSGDRFWIARHDKPIGRDDFRFLPLEVYGPKNSDGSFERFLLRISAEFGNLPIGINIHHLEKSSPELWFRFRDFVSGLNRVTGELPSGRWDIDTFFGTYQTTPLGIHKDNASVFAMGIMGNRTYYTWPEDYFHPGDAALSTLDPATIQQHLDSAVRMDLAPGDVIYWPSSNWHLVMSDGSPSAAISISAYFGEKLSTLLSGHLRATLAGQLGKNDSYDVYNLNETHAGLPGMLGSASNWLQETVGMNRLHDSLLQYWLMFRSAEGLHSVSSDSNAELGREDCISVDSRYPIIWEHASGGGFIVSINGLAFAVSTENNDIIIQMLEQLNTGQQFTVLQLAGEYGQKGVSTNSIIGVLALLHRCRAFQVAGSSM